MYPQNNYYYPQPTQTNAYGNTFQALAQGLKGRPVSSFEEARAMTIDFDGTTFFFPDLANKRIYTKQINLDGTASLCVYELRQLPLEPLLNSNNDNYITREEFEKAIAELKEATKMNIASPTPNTTVTATAKPEQNYAKFF